MIPKTSICALSPPKEVVSEAGVNREDSRKVRSIALPGRTMLILTSSAPHGLHLRAERVALVGDGELSSPISTLTLALAPNSACMKS